MEDEDNFDLLFQQKLNDGLFDINSNNDLEVLKKKGKTEPNWTNKIYWHNSWWFKSWKISWVTWY